MPRVLETYCCKCEERGEYRRAAPKGAYGVNLGRNRVWERVSAVTYAVDLRTKQVSHGYCGLCWAEEEARIEEAFSR